MSRVSLLLSLSLFVACGVEQDSPAGSSGEVEATTAEQPLCLELNYLDNATFNTVGPLGASTSVTLAQPGGAGASAADAWTLFMNTTPATLRTRLLPSTRPGDATRMIHVLSTAPGNGLVQVFQPFGSGPTKVISRAWVYVVKGQVAIGTGNGGNTGYDAHSTTTGQWELIEASNGNIPANEFILYATSPGGAEFYVDHASVVFAPNLLLNPTFAAGGGPTAVVTQVPGGAGSSAASSWTLFTNTAGYIGTELLPSTLPGGQNMLHVKTFGPGNGLVQVFHHACYDNPPHTTSGAFVFVKSGKVCIGTGNGGNTQCDRTSTTLNQWEWLEAPNGVSPANTFIVYATTPGGADFHVGFARANKTP